MKHNGVLSSVKLIHVSGYITCDRGMSYWGCAGKDLSVVLTDSDDVVIMPDFMSATGWFTLPGYDSFSKQIVLVDQARRMYAHRGQRIRIWYGDALKERLPNRRGRLCVDVYVMFK